MKTLTKRPFFFFLLLLFPKIALSVELRNLLGEIQKQYSGCLGRLILDREASPFRGHAYIDTVRMIKPDVGMVLVPKGLEKKIQTIIEDGAIFFQYPGGGGEVAEVRKMYPAQLAEAQGVKYYFIELKKPVARCHLTPIDSRSPSQLANRRLEGAFLGFLEPQSKRMISDQIESVYSPNNVIRAHVLKFEGWDNYLDFNIGLSLVDKYVEGKSMDLIDYFHAERVIKIGKSDYDDLKHQMREGKESTYQNRLIARYYAPDMDRPEKYQLFKIKEYEKIFFYPKYNFIPNQGKDMVEAQSLVFSLVDDQVQFLGVGLGSKTSLHKISFRESRSLHQPYAVLVEPATSLYQALERSGYQGTSGTAQLSSTRLSEEDLFKLLGVEPLEQRKGKRRKFKNRALSFDFGEISEPSVLPVEPKSVPEPKHEDIHLSKKIGPDEVLNRWFAGIITKPDGYRELVAYYFGAGNHHCQNRVGLLKFASLMGTHIARGRCDLISSPTGKVIMMGKITNQWDQASIQVGFTVYRDEEGVVALQEMKTPEGQEKLVLRPVVQSIRETFSPDSLVEPYMSMAESQIHFGAEELALGTKELPHESFEGRWIVCGEANPNRLKVVPHENAQNELMIEKVGTEYFAHYQGARGEVTFPTRYDLEDLELRKPFRLLHVSFSKFPERLPQTFNIYLSQDEKKVYLSTSARYRVFAEGGLLDLKRPSEFFCKSQTGP